MSAGGRDADAWWGVSPGGQQHRPALFTPGDRASDSYTAPTVATVTVRNEWDEDLYLSSCAYPER